MTAQWSTCATLENEIAIVPGVASRFFSTIVLFKNRSLFLRGFGWFLGKTAARKEWKWKVPLESAVWAADTARGMGKAHDGILRFGRARGYREMIQANVRCCHPLSKQGGS